MLNDTYSYTIGDICEQWCKYFKIDTIIECDWTTTYECVDFREYINHWGSQLELERTENVHTNVYILYSAVGTVFFFASRALYLYNHI